MEIIQNQWGTLYKTDLLIMGNGASGIGAALRAGELKKDVLVVGKGTLESSGSLGGGNDHFMAVLETNEQGDTREEFLKHYVANAYSNTLKLCEQWFDSLKPCIHHIEASGSEFLHNPDGSYHRSQAYGQPGAWWIHIPCGRTIKRNLAKRVRSMKVNVLDNIQITNMFAKNGQFVGCTGFNILTGAFIAIECKKAINCLGYHAQRATANSTGNPFNCWFHPFTNGAYLTMPYNIGAALINVDIGQRGTLEPKGWGAPGMNGINNMGGHELNALGLRFMQKYDPNMENCKRRVQVMGTHQEQVEGNGPPFYMDMRHFSKEDAYHLQHVLMAADKETYPDYCRALDIDFAKYPLEIEIGEMALSGQINIDDRFESSIKGLFAGCNFNSFSGSMCNGYAASFHASHDTEEAEMQSFTEEELLSEKDRVFAPLKREKADDTITQTEFEGPIRQIMQYYVGFRRNMIGMQLALKKFDIVEKFKEKVAVANLHELMRLHESFELLDLCRIHIGACLQRKESGRGLYQLADYPNIDPNLNRGLIVHQENGQAIYTWQKR